VKKSLRNVPQAVEKLLPERKRGSSREAVEKHIYLQVGDKVFHRNYKGWGFGVVIEAWASEVPGGLCFARIQFQDGKMRVFDNSFDSSCCCYYAGITLLNRIEL
jgi:hypothetical protein